MKKLFVVILAGATLTVTSCGPSAEEKAKKEKEYNDSVQKWIDIMMKNANATLTSSKDSVDAYNAKKQSEDSIAKFEAGNKKK
jgi:Zn-dependent M16 (insulinase) family peptidase